MSRKNEFDSEEFAEYSDDLQIENTKRKPFLSSILKIGALSGAVLTPTATGSCVVQSNLAANANYLAETSTATTINIASGLASAALTLAPGNFVYRQAKAITAVATVAGKITFRVAGKILPGCKNKTANAGNSFTAICSYKPSNHSYVTISATLVPTDVAYTGSVTNTAQYLVTRRTGAR